MTISRQKIKLARYEQLNSFKFPLKKTIDLVKKLDDLNITKLGQINFKSSALSEPTASFNTIEQEKDFINLKELLACPSVT